MSISGGMAAVSRRMVDAIGPSAAVRSMFQQRFCRSLPATGPARPGHFQHRGIHASEQIATRPRHCRPPCPDDRPHPPVAPSGPARARFAAAIDRLAQGFVVLDRRFRLVINNDPDLRVLPAGRAAPCAGDAALRHHCRQCRRRPPSRAQRRRAACRDDGALRPRRAVFLPPRAARRTHRPRRVAPLPDGGWVGTYEDITEQHHSVVRMAHMARHDGLTDLFNRDGFTEAIGRALARARRGEDFAVLALSLDRFDKVNDSLGHATGDAVLREAAARLRRSVRAVDEVARLGVEEFAVVQTGLEQPAGAEALARRIAEVLSAPFLVEGQEIALGVCVGIALGDPSAQTPEAMLRNATLALGRARGEPGRPAGQAAWRFFADEMDAAARSRRSLEADLRHALERDEFELFYQPLVNIGEGG